jgi:hypothetical protein
MNVPELPAAILRPQKCYINIKEDYYLLKDYKTYSHTSYHEDMKYYMNINTGLNHMENGIINRL